MTLLDNHLEQISLSSHAIAELPFATPRIFTNALLHSHDITALIRDTELHERALFTLAPREQYSDPTYRMTGQHSIVHGNNNAGQLYGKDTSFRGPGLTVATLLGGKLGEQVRKDGLTEDKVRGEADVSLLLEGAEKLCGIYPITGAPARIASLRSRYELLDSSITRFEARISKQTTQLAKMNKLKQGDESIDDEDDDMIEEMDENMNKSVPISKEDLSREDEEIKELEKKKRGLEDRVSGMERDLGGLLR